MPVDPLSPLTDVTDLTDLTDAAPGPELPARLGAAAPRVVVVGDTVLDLWLAGPSRRLSREAPVPVVEVQRSRPAAGAAANTAVNLAALGARASLVSTLGDDGEGRTVRSLLVDAGVDVSGLITDARRPTAAKRRILADEALVARYDTAPSEAPSESVRAQLLAELTRALDDGPDAVVVCDYGGGLHGDDVVALLGAGPRPWRLVVDAHDPARWAAARPDAVTPSAGEAGWVLGRELPGPDRAAAAEAAAPALRAATGAATVVVTLDRDGALLLPDPDDPAGAAPPHRTFARPAPDSRTCGAGDTFTAAFALGLAAGVPTATAVELAQAAADVVVGYPGTAVCTGAELTERLSEGQGNLLADAALARVCAEHRAGGRRVVFTNGCFDVVHRGHVAYLNQAKRLGDVLVVALNCDDGVQRLKGPGRPLNALADRAAVVGALSCVDHVVAFSDDTPAALLAEIRPDVYAKGGDYTAEMLSETPVVRAYGGRVVILDYLPDRSTSAIVARARSGSSS